MPVDSTTAIARVWTSIEDLRTAFSLSNYYRLHADVVGYSRALLDCGIITDQQWRQLHHAANTALSAWRHAPEFSIRLQAWEAKSY